ncbi:MAG: four-carbon acid sugar kinase family protein, partial [Melioribacteraceae bacterium]|nr:four-carbon acid sugar kinase family protein [Melioribacteraceae bacterium]
LRYGLNVRIETDVIEVENVDLLVIATDTRSMDSKSAAQVVTDIMLKLIEINPQVIYKKIDSVLRGFIIAELESFINVIGGSQIVLVSANPSMGRIIKDKTYYINEVPLHRTGFSNDPDFPVKTSNVLELLGPSSLNTSIANVSEDKISEGIVIAEAENEEDLRNWARSLKNNFLHAGAAGYFVALLEQLGYKSTIDKKPVINIEDKKCIYVCGSAIDSSRLAVNEVKKSGPFVCEMPEEIIFQSGDHANNMEKWFNEIEKVLEEHDRVIVAVNRSLIKEEGMAASLRKHTAEAVCMILKKHIVDELMIEGGATAYSIIQKCEYHKFDPVQELSHGVLRMGVIGKEDFHITLKPGSYKWPGLIWDF